MNISVVQSYLLLLSRVKELWYEPREVVGASMLRVLATGYSCMSAG